MSMVRIKLQDGIKQLAPQCIWHYEEVAKGMQRMQVNFRNNNTPAGRLAIKGDEIMMQKSADTVICVFVAVWSRKTTYKMIFYTMLLDGTHVHYTRFFRKLFEALRDTTARWVREQHGSEHTMNAPAQ